LTQIGDGQQHVKQSRDQLDNIERELDLSIRNVVVGGGI
jgi:hypothetical protein